ncbi:Alanine--tRNA ligase [Candidatus Rhabdochlamydia oedothoracis]|uniref:Alanine--tRNA ligase n=1 Tax=Candidatus Rhabdochlamydia oedothoracis TaxID=2720720 RepID=A0ABX8V4B1_9BACT|nr:MULTISPECIES: alanine--tRNA ligase [Rhabdochlamydia]KAG6559130.1 Alanine--tRNA ligase [Candidatus Rhabdochlamydia sp. W815]MCL6755902.1 alanine--tRNA ligase [Candidatus Rhabdochlamydia oedothoracis]QYF49342.1 Alanine--tRNA ligase [Candidatus Rhabdochlamydia oedothoracis]
MLSQQIRTKFLQYFKDKGHTIVSSSSVIPHDDPTILFINAGMNQFKDVFLGKNERGYTKATTCQKCIRVGGKHNDLDNVGHTSRHLTFFEMLGNFSFGDYFKAQAIQYAWEVSTTVFGFDAEKIWATVFEEDDEAFELWKAYLPEKRIVRMGEKDNFWSMGDTGPCGPCSELLFDRGPSYGRAFSPLEDPDGERFLEFWNLVFMQFNRDASLKQHPLPKKSIDTGAGLERIVSLKLGVDSVFEIDIFQAFIAEVARLCNKPYRKEDPQLAPAYHVIADHVRSLSFAIADGAQPSNTERGYILRKLLRRAVRYGRILGLQKPFLADMLPCLIDTMGSDYKELVESQTRIADILSLEEETFLRTLKRGGNILNTIIDQTKTSSSKQISGKNAFKLKDTYGFPLEEILLIAKDNGLKVDLDAYLVLENQAKIRSKAAQTIHFPQKENDVFKEYIKHHPTTGFLGYTQTEAEAAIIGILIDGKFVEEIKEGQNGHILLDKTPFYPEKGGQVGDTGSLTHKEAHFKVTHCHSPFPGIIAHLGKLEKGCLLLGEPLSAQVDKQKRQEIANNHTATHLLHWALQKVVGAHIRQAGSLVAEDHLRFDFNHHKALSKEEIRQIERLIQEKIREGQRVQTYEISFEKAQKDPDIKQFFGDKYAAIVRVVDIDYSKELCGGTHAENVSTIGSFRIVKESSIASGVRRIEAYTRVKAEEWIYEQEDRLEKAATLLKSSPLQLVEKTQNLIEENKILHTEIKALKSSQLKQLTQTLLTKVQYVGSIPFMAQIVDTEELNALSEQIAQALSSYVVILAHTTKERCQVMVRVSKDLSQKGILASSLIKEIVPIISGGGGGKKESAQAGGKNPEGLLQAFEQVQKWLLQNA